MHEAIKVGRKFEQVLAGARAIFMRDGFEGASVDDIAKEAGVSKATLYSYFPDKRLLFAEVARAESTRQAESAVSKMDAAVEPEEALRTAGEHFIGFLTSEFGISVVSLCAAESRRFPELGRQFYASGPKLVRERLGNYLRDAVSRDKLAIDDIDLAADQFAELCKTWLFSRILCGVQTKFTAEERQRVLDGAVQMFLARYGK